MTLAEGGSELLHHLMVDYLIKAVIVVVAVVVLLSGLVILWKRAGRD